MLLPCLVGLGAGVGVTFVATAALSMTEVPEADTGVASALLSTFQAVGGTIGVAVVASLAATRTDARLAAAAPPLTPDVVREALLSGSWVGFVVTTSLAGAAVLVALATAPRRTAGVPGRHSDQVDEPRRPACELLTRSHSAQVSFSSRLSVSPPAESASRDSIASWVGAPAMISS
ncbi:hypothetical protein [Nocardioides sp. W7]|uniref:hypothetical protein n=1 Tax=Nocardioides sp. W7 TaxID=2931390 RepID=UPI001FD2BCD2|nr:hypothetical protein [Nocardioides sp. W7]